MANHNGLVIIACLVTAGGIGLAAFYGNQYNHTKHFKESTAVVLESHEKIEKELTDFTNATTGKNLEIPDFDAADQNLKNLQKENQAVHESASELRPKNDDAKAIQQDLDHVLTSFDTMLTSYDEVVESQKAELLSTDKEKAHETVEAAMAKAHNVNQEYTEAKSELQKKLE